MQELPQILKKEQEQKEKIEQARKAAQQEIETRKQELTQKLAKESVLSENEKNEILEHKQKEIKTIRAESEKRLEAALRKLETQTKANFQKAVEFVVKELLEQCSK